MKKLKLAFFFCLLFILVGCATQPEIKYVTKIETNTVVLEPPVVLTAPVKHIKPPNPKEYSTSSWDDKEKILFEYINKLDTQIDAFLIDRVGITKWVSEQKKNLEARDKK
jgi:hypothetical protein